MVAAKTIRLRDKEHRSSCPCSPAWSVDARQPIPIICVLRSRGRISRKVSDEFTVPVCRLHHRELHRTVMRNAWWQGIKIDPLPIALRLWRQARPTGPATSMAL